MAARSDIVLELGSVSAEPEADVSGVLRGAEERNGLGQQLRSLAHPAWPYAGTPHAWRGFVKVEVRFQKLNFGPDLP
jgi:hypothetical protein